MPMYTYMCRPCDHTEDRYLTFAEAGVVEPVCPKCEEPMKRDFSAIRLRIITGCVGYTTTDITGAPVHVGTRKQERALCEASGVRRVSSDEIRVKKKAKPKLTEPLSEAFERKRHEMGVEL